MRKEDPCQYCSKPVGYGDHEQYCSENPVNLARVCLISGCNRVGNIISDYEWSCRHHVDLRYAHDRVNSTKNSIWYAKHSMKRLHEEIENLRLSIPELVVKSTEAQENLEKVKFKASLAGLKL